MLGYVVAGEKRKAMTENPIKLSVVITHYNEPAALSRSLAHIAFALHGMEIELIVVDDGSTPSNSTQAAALADLYECQWHPIGRNVGVPAAMNAGLSLANGEFIYFAACGDLVAPNFFKTALHQLEVHKHLRPAMCCAKSQWTDTRNGFTWIDSVGMDRRGYMEPAEVAKAIRKRRLHITSHTTLFRRDTLMAHGGFAAELKWHCDFHATNGFALKYGTCFVPDVGVNVRLESGSYSDVDRWGPAHRRVLDDLLEIAPEQFDVVLDQFGLPGFEAVLVSDKWKRLITFGFFLRCLRRELQTLGRKYLPLWLQRLAINIA